jgi:hypothetical protein
VFLKCSVLIGSEILIVNFKGLIFKTKPDVKHSMVFVCESTMVKFKMII